MSEKYYHTNESVKEYIRLAKGVDGKEHIHALREYLPSNSSVLEIGSGPGKDWQILSEYYKVIGSDNSEIFLEHLQEHFKTGQFMKLDAAVLDTDEKFDGIYSNKVMHHLSDIELAKSARRQHEILNSNGIICLTFWKGEGSETFKGMFVNYYSSADLKAVFEKYFDICTLEEYEEFEAGDSIRLIAKKKV